MSAPEITIFVRHTPGCKYAGDDFARRCDCRKHLRWTLNGKRVRRPAGTRNWAEAEKVKRELEDQLAGRQTVPDSVSRLIGEAVSVFIQDKNVQGVTPGVIKKYTLELKRLEDYCTEKSALTVLGLTRELLTGYCATWAAQYPSSLTRSKVRERLRSFLRYCYEAKWLDRIPALPKIKVESSPTMPLTPDEYRRLLDALYVTNPKRWDGKSSTQSLTEGMRERIRGLIQIMRWSGLAIIDAVRLPKSEMVWDARGTLRVMTARQKTGTDVSVLLPPDVSAELTALSARNATFVLFPEQMDWVDIAKTYTSRYIRPAFEAAGIPCNTHMVSHRFRDTFACDLLEKGVPLEEVSKLLGHESIRTTEKHYAKWVRGRQDRLDNLVVGTWTGPEYTAPHGRPDITTIN